MAEPLSSFSALSARLRHEGAELIAEGEGYRVLVKSAVQAARIVAICAEEGATLSAERGTGALRFDRRRLDRLGRIHPSAMWIEVGGGARLEEIEGVLARWQLTLGEQPPSVRSGTAAQWLEGPHAGRRVENGRLVSAVAAIRGVLVDGTSIETRASPRSAAGPGLLGLVLGAHGKTGFILGATLRAERIPKSAETIRFAGAPEAMGRLLARAIEWPRLPLSGELLVRSRSLLSLQFAGDAAKLGHVIRNVRLEARALGLDRRATPREPTQSGMIRAVSTVPAQPVRILVEHELELLRAPQAFASLVDGDHVQLSRIAREGAVAATSPEAGVRLQQAASTVPLAYADEPTTSGAERALFESIVAAIRAPKSREGAR